MTKGLKTDWDGHDSRQWEQIRAFEHGQQMGIEREQERIIKLLETLATHKDCNMGEHHEDYVWNSPLGIIEVLTEWDSEPIALIKGENK